MPGATIWYVGHWGFQFYAERAGLKAIVPNRSKLRAGDWLVIPDQNVDQQLIQLAVGQVNPAHTITRWHLFGYRTLPWRYYSGSTPIDGDRSPGSRSGSFGLRRISSPRGPGGFSSANRPARRRGGRLLSIAAPEGLSVPLVDG